MQEMEGSWTSEGTALISGLEQALLTVMVLAIMFGMGATLKLENFRLALRRPLGVLIGFASQFGFMPLCAFGLAHLLGLDPVYAVALIIIGCLPAGTTSNMFAYFSRGDVALSISMTTASTLAALVMMPLLLGLYASPFAAQIAADAGHSGEAFAIPFTKIIVTLLGVLLPIAGGMLLLHKSPGWAKAAEDWASFLGLFVIIFLLGSMIIRHGDLLLETGPELYVASIAVGILGFCFGYGTARLFRMPGRLARTISLETGIQNGPLAFAIILLSFEPPYMASMLWLAIVYSFFIVLTSSCITLLYRNLGAKDSMHYENDLVARELFHHHYHPSLTQSPKFRS